MKILCIQLRQLGDVLTTTPAVRQLRALYPQAEIVFISEPLGANVYEHNPRVSQLWIVERYCSYWTFIKFLWRVYRARFDLVIDFATGTRSAQIAFASRAKERVGFNFRFRRLLYTRRVVIEDDDEYAVRSKNRLITHLGGDINDDAIEFFVDAVAQKMALEFAKKYDFGNNTIAFCVVSRLGNRTIDPAFWAEVGDALIVAGYKLWFVHGPGEKAMAEVVYKLLRNKQACIIDYEMSTVARVRALMERCRLFVGNDGGNKHICAAAGVLTITVFIRARASNWTQSGHIAFQIEDGISPQVVIDACLSQLNGNKPK
jgi:ADP-heptose:LPS heptosyltransferase